jgi:hypothetical protein
MGVGKTGLQVISGMKIHGNILDNKWTVLNFKIRAMII